MTQTVCHDAVYHLSFPLLALFQPPASSRLLSRVARYQIPMQSVDIQYTRGKPFCLSVCLAFSSFPRELSLGLSPCTQTPTCTRGVQSCADLRGMLSDKSCNGQAVLLTRTRPTFSSLLSVEAILYRIFVVPPSEREASTSTRPPTARTDKRSPT